MRTKVNSDRFRKSPGPKPRPRIWTSGSQRPPFVLRAFARAGLFLSRQAVGGLFGRAARLGRRVAVNVKSGAGRIPADRLGRTGRYLPSHLRVAAWIRNLAATLAHASATADTDFKRGNALVAEIEPHLWPDVPPGTQGIPAAPGPVAKGAVQVGGYLIGWAVSLLALPYGLGRALWQFAKGEDLRKIGAED